MQIIKNIHDVDTRYEFIQNFKDCDFLQSWEITMLKAILKDKDVLYVFYKGFNYSITRNIKRVRKKPDNKLDLDHIANLLNGFGDPKHNKKNKS